MKKILDSVHGHILVDDCYITAIIDTPEFQRWRRVEQTSIRSVYPSDRHDRFIQSLGVFYGTVEIEIGRRERRVGIDYLVPIFGVEHRCVEDAFKVIPE